MSGKIIVVCGACQKKLGVPETASGKRIRCPGCSEPISVPVSSAGPPSGASRRPRTATAGKSPQRLESAGASARKKRSAPTNRKAGTKRRYAEPADEDLFGGDSYGDDAYGDDLYGDDLYGDEPSAKQLPSAKRKKKGSSSRSSDSASSSGGFLDSFGGQRARAMGTGILMMVGAAVWFVGAIVYADRIFFYPPILFIMGIATVVKAALAR